MAMVVGCGGGNSSSKGGISFSSLLPSVSTSNKVEPSTSSSAPIETSTSGSSTVSSSSKDEYIPTPMLNPDKNYLSYRCCCMGMEQLC